MAKKLLYCASDNALGSIETDNPIFGNLMVGAFGGSWRNSSPQEDKIFHIDIFHRPPDSNYEYGIDIKTEARIRRSDERTDPDFQWIQVTTKIGSPGALYGKADYFGFINSKGNLLTPMKYVRKFYEEIVDKKEVTKHPMRENVNYRRKYLNKNGEMVCPPEKSFLMRYIDLKCVSDYRFDENGKAIPLPAKQYGEKWVDFYISTIKEEFRKKSWGELDTLYDKPNDIYLKFIKR